MRQLTLLTSILLAASAWTTLSQELGKPAPELTITDWAQGEPFKLADGKGKNVYVVEFWATWCGPSGQASLTSPSFKLSTKTRM